MTEKKKKRVVSKRKWITFVGREKTKKYWEIMTSLDGQYFGADWPYVLEEEYKPFFINISSHLRLWDTDESWSLNNLSRKVKNWFENSNRKQIGAHLLSTRLGKLQMVYTTVETKTDTIETTQPNDINCIFPVIRNEEEKGVETLLMGLHFASCDQKKDRNTGNRLYHRFDYNFNQEYNTWEVTELMFDEKFVRQWYSFDNRPHFALFVCSGAKLTVQDNCHTNGRTYSLFQQGGLVIVEGELSIRVKGLEHYYTFADSLNSGIIVPQRSDWSLNDYKNPVLFLGATESKYDSICWDLMIHQKRDDEGTGAFYLMLPDGGHFESIEEWNFGIELVLGRHSYQRLHESNVIQEPGGQPYSRVDFKIPHIKLFAAMIGVDPQRQAICNLRKKLSNECIKTLDSQPCLPKEYNFRKVFKASTKTLPHSKDNYGITTSPAYPPIEYKIDNSWHYLYLPNNKEKDFTDSVDRHYVWLEIEKGKPKECCLQYGSRTYRLTSKEKTIPLDEFESRKNVDQLIGKSESQRYALCDGSNTRLGTDGWLYTITASDKALATFHTQYYYKFHKNIEK